MSILITGIKMPDDCCECPCVDYEYGNCQAGATGIWPDKGRRKNCPLYEVKEEDNMVSLETMKMYYEKFRDQMEMYFNLYQDTGKSYYLNRYHEKRELYEITEKAINHVLSKIGETNER